MHNPLTRKRPLALATAALILVLAQLSFGGAAFADDNVGLSGKPAGADGKADGRTRFSYQIDPGKRVEDSYLVQNVGTTAQTFTVLATDAFNDDEGNYGVLDTDVSPTTVGNWVHFENGDRTIQKVLQPGEEWLVPFTVLVPPNASPGDHPGGIVASVQSTGSEVIVDRRVAARLYVRVAGDLQAMLSVSGMEAKYSGDWWNLFSGTVTVDYVVRNTGNVALAATMDTGVHTWFGVDAAAVQHEQLDEILPGYTRDVSVTMPAVAQWLYLNPYVSLYPYVDDEIRPQVAVSDANHDTVLLVVPWLVVIALAIVALILLLRRFLLRREARRAEEWMEYTEREAQRKAEEGAAVKTSAGGRD